MANDKVAIIAGVGPGIGARFVETFAQQGYRVVALARNDDSLEQIRVGLGATAERSVFWTADITDQEQVKKTFVRVRNELGPVNLLICNAGGGVKRGSFLDITPQDFLKNLHGGVWPVPLRQGSNSRHAGSWRRDSRLHRRHQFSEGLC